MNCCSSENAIVVVKGNDTDFNGQNLLTIYLRSEVLDLSDLSATFTLCGLVKTFNDLSSGEIVLNYNNRETSSIPFGKHNGVLNIVSKSHKISTIESLIPFDFVSIVHGNAIATKPYEMTFNVEQGGETILNVSVEAGVSVEVGTTTTLPAGENATVTNSGSPNHLILDFGIPRGDGIVSVEKTSTDVLTDTYTITFESGLQTTFNIENGRGIISISKTGTSGLVDTYTILFNDGTSTTFNVKNGEDAKINGVTTLTLNASNGISLSQIGNTATISGKSLQDGIAEINSLIPSQATTSNKLADKNFVNSSIATNTANFIGTFNSLAELEAYSGTVTNNDYAFVVGTDGEGNTVYDRYKYTDATDPASWVFEYELNNSSFTAAQWDAINSGATTTNISQITTNKNAIGVLSNLETNEKSNLVGAINEVYNTTYDEYTSTNNRLISLSEWISGSFAGDEFERDGYSSTNIIEQNMSLTEAVSALDESSGSLSSLTTTQKSTLVGAINELNSTKANATDVNSALDGKIDKGYAVNDFATNCITEIPQDIKLEFSGDTITLKAGSVYTLPDGTQNQTVSDLSLTTAFSNSTLMLCVRENGSQLFDRNIENCVSGPGATTNGGFALDTTALKVAYTSSNGTVLAYASLPIAIFKVGYNHQIQSIEQVFNGFGFIGSTIFALPDVKGLIPDGRNSDGTIKTINATNTAVRISTYTGTGVRYVLMNYVGGLGVLFDFYPGSGYYDPDTNYIIRGSGAIVSGQCVVGIMNYTNSKIDSFDINPISGLTANIVNNAIGYTPQAISTIETLDATDSITLADNTIYNGGTQTALTIALWSNPTVSVVAEIMFSSGSTATTLSYPNTIKWLGDDITGGLFIPVENKRYTVIFYYDGSETVGVVKGVE